MIIFSSIQVFSSRSGRILDSQMNDANGKPQLTNQYKLLLVQQFPNSKEAKQFSSDTTIQQQPAAYDVRELLEYEQAY